MKLEPRPPPRARTEPDLRDPVEVTLEDLVYEHLADLVDFDRMYQLEQLVELRLEQLVEVGALSVREPEDHADRAAAIVARAWHRLIDDPRRYVDLRGRWQPDDECELCQALAATAKPDG